MLYPKLESYYLIEKLFSEKLGQTYKRKEIIFSFENIMEIIEDHIKLLDDAYENIHPELEVIDKEINELGRLKK